MIRATIGILAGTGRKPVALAATGVGETSFTANWEAFEGAVYYLLDVSTQEDFSTFVYENEIIYAPTTSYVVIGLEDNTTYYYRLRASTEPLYLLDEWEYPDAAAAYSLRKLRHEYKGAAVEVRNDGGVHLDIGFDESGDLDTAALLAHCGSGDGTVSTWYDQSGNGRNATQSTAAGQQIIVESGTVLTLNSKPIAKGGYNYTVQNPFTHIDISTFTVGQGTTKTNPFSNKQRAIMWASTSPTLKYFYAEDITFSGFQANTVNPNYAFINGSTKSTTLNRDEVATEVDSQSLISLNWNSINSQINRIGYSANDFNLYDLQEIVFYPSDQSSNRTGIQTNINSHYQIYWDGSQTSLLDSYSGSAAAYSLRALNSAYTGPLVEVRNGSGVHADIYAKYDGSLNTDALLAHCGSGDGTVSTWYDQSGNGNDATQSTAANQPQIVSSGSVITLNSKPAIQAASTLKGFDVGQFTWSEGSISTVFNRTGRIGAFDSLWIFDGGEPYNQLYSTGSDWLYYSTGTYTTSIPLTTSQKLITMNDNGTATSFYDDSSLDSTFSISNNVSNLTLRLMYSQSRAWLGNMQEFVFWDSDQSSNRTGIETNINAEYQIYWDGSQTSLLDSYGGSAAAYSLRALNSAYTGPLVEVRRDLDNATTDIYAKYDGSLNVDALESFCSGTDGFVTTWYDQSGSGNNATQINASEQPQIVSSGSVIVENGKPAIQNSATTGFNLTSNITIDSFTILWVARKETIASNGSIMLYISAATFLGDDVNGKGNPTFWGMIETQYSNTSASDIEINQHLSYLNRRNSTEAVGQFNDSNNSYNNSVDSTQYQISKIALYGTSYNYIGNIQELIIYSSDESSNRTGISTNINDFYNIY